MTNTPPSDATPPPPPPPPPSPAAAPAPTGKGIAMGPAQILGVVGGAVVLVSTWLNWVSTDFEDLQVDFSAYEIPAYILIDNTVNIPAAGINLGVLTFVIAAVCIVGALVAPVRWLMLVGGIVAVGIAVDFLWQMNLLAGDLEDNFGIDAGVFDLAGFAPVIALVGGVVAIVGGALAFRRP
jgi:hypothetical protein